MGNHKRPADTPVEKGGRAVENSPTATSLVAMGRSAVPLGQQPQPERVELDESRRILLVVGAGVVLDGDVAFRVQRVGTLAPDHAGEAFVELEPDRARDLFMRKV